MQPDELDELYGEVILDHYRSPRNARAVEHAHVQARGFNPFCGDEVNLQLSLDGIGAIEDVGCLGSGCSISQASASMLTEALKGKTLGEAESLRTVFRRVMQGEALTPEEREAMGELEALIGVRKFPVRIKCALLAWAALEDGIKQYNAEDKQAT